MEILNNDFYTFSEYMKKENNSLTASMEDYLEMIYRLSIKTGFVRLHELADALNVQPPSATKMVQKLAELNLINYEKYGVITLKDTGKAIGKNLIKRHNTIIELLKTLGIEENHLLEETEKIEHTISENTLQCFTNFIEFLKANKDVKKRLSEYISSKK
ncbi:iron dependent repressor, metal binding and dimerization domain protein [Thermoanaerobacterium thermosaccharolyticum]|uniref:metal-dependent transcriptional regulator n=1 Tax=Thermoanaerobacterium thermosaccharolyticum TaxID=1517 RepID=UPI0021516CF7|nr:iron dependent repressor, metal binding and dimerization domain protein [Thermoanaerobacterium thermosaccharolyticum]